MDKTQNCSICKQQLEEGSKHSSHPFHRNGKMCCGECFVTFVLPFKPVHQKLKERMKK